jgi:hypothetical protein
MEDDWDSYCLMVLLLLMLLLLFEVVISRVAVAELVLSSEQ